MPRARAIECTWRDRSSGMVVLRVAISVVPYCWRPSVVNPAVSSKPREELSVKVAATPAPGKVQRAAGRQLPYAGRPSAPGEGDCRGTPQATPPLLSSPSSHRSLPASVVAVCRRWGEHVAAPRNALCARDAGQRRCQVTKTPGRVVGAD